MHEHFSDIYEKFSQMPMSKTYLNVDMLRPGLIVKSAFPFVRLSRQEARSRVQEQLEVVFALFARDPLPCLLNLVACPVLHVPTHPTNALTRRETV